MKKEGLDESSYYDLDYGTYLCKPNLMYDVNQTLIFKWGIGFPMSKKETIDICRFDYVGIKSSNGKIYRF